MATKWISPTWRMPEESNQSKFENYSLNFNGSDNRIQIPYTELNGSTNCTISFWAKINYAADSEAKYPLHLTSGTNNPILWIFPANGTDLDVYIGTVNFRLDGSFNRDIAEWNHWVLRFDGTGSSGNRTFVYQNGQQLTNQTGWAGATSIATASHLILGGRNLNATQWYYQFPGDISDVSIFDYTLTEQQITSLYNSNTPINPMAITPPPITYYPLGGSSTGSASTLTIPNESVPSATVFDFDGSNKITGTGDLISGNESRSFSLWYKTTSTAAQIPFSLGSPTDQTNGAQFAYCINRSSTTNAAIFGKNSAYDTSVFTVPNTSDGNWHHLLVTYNQSALKVYIDGNLEATPALPSSSYITSAGFTIGGWTIVGNRLFNGEISNVQVWNAELESSDVTTLYNNGVPLLSGTQPQAANLKGWWKMNVDTSNWDLTSTSWSITKIGSPYFNGASDGAYAQNGVLRSQDTDSYTIASGDYFQWNSPTIYTSGSDIVLSSSGGEANGQTSGVEIIYQYNIDNTSWTTWHQHTYTGTTDQAYAVPSTSPLTVSSNIKIRVQLAGGPNNNSFVDVSDINITGGTSSYSEDFSNVTKYGWFGGGETANPTTTAWIITDSSGNKNTGTSSGMTTANLVNSDLTRSIPYSSYSMTFDGIADEIQLTSDFVAAGEFTLSLWINPDNVVDNNFLGDGSSSNNWIQIKTATQLKVKVASTVTTFNESGGNNLTASAWNHVLIYRNASNDVSVYVNGKSFGSPSNNTNTLTLSTIGRATGIFFEGNISNVAFWSSSLTEDQVLTIYNGGVPNDISSLSPVSWWSLAGDSYYDGTNWICPDLGSGSNNGTSSGMGGTELVGNGPGSTANGIATSMDIPANLKGNAPNSSKNAFSINMNSADRVEDVPA